MAVAWFSWMVFCFLALVNVDAFADVCPVLDLAFSVSFNVVGFLWHFDVTSSTHFDYLIEK
jgi:hypothetical protein